MAWIGLYYCKKALYLYTQCHINKIKICKLYKHVANGFIMNLQVTLVHVLSLTMNIFDKSK